ncbi:MULTISPECIES: MerR family transcriptional regulator [unclassified Streptomyces]|uniref:MerR family transcriptional regulator n=1 Tax=unclassified Streptomyces TaxID=2593676 RepID=UPI00225B2E46|nr:MULTISPECIES: MerR family transcriptional regulator [unclassified Streptomyces]MCX4978988.1 MerR family transcriptional regulator [Streptomyces sp. NBC_00620]WTB37539.1 MerR family transcriptional regulator [Streptomyces sp. NBC_00827]WUC14734.1 MerR family transcriptional regulator [Streptomyces sp. NBC_00564]
MRRESIGMLIGELSRRTGVSTRSLRYYEQQGLLAAGRTANGYRDYDESVVVRAANIQGLLRAGLTVDDIREPLGHGCLDEPLDQLPLCEGALETAADRLDELDRRIGALRQLRERLAGQVERTRDALDAREGS